MNEQIGMRGMLRALKEEAPHWAVSLPALPRLLHEMLTRDPLPQIDQGFRLLLAEQHKRNRWLMIIATLLGAITLLLWFC